MTATDRGASAASWWPWLVLPASACAMVASGLLLGAAVDAPFADDVEVFLNVPLAIEFSTVAAGVWATRPDTRGLRRLGVLYTVVGLGSALAFPSKAWAYADRAQGGLPAGAAAEWLGDWVWALGAAPLMALGLLLYPDGRLPGRHWWPAAVVGLLAVVLIAVGNALGAEAVAGPGVPLMMVAAAAGLAGLVVRFIRAEPGSDLRGQLGAFLLASLLAVLSASIPDGNTVWHLFMFLAAGAALPITVASAVIRHRLLDPTAELSARLDAATASRRTLVTEREDERMRLRRDLHDGLGPSLAAIGLGLRQLQDDVPDGQHPVVMALADEVQRAVAEVRRICDGLRPEALQELGLEAALRGAAERLSSLGGPIVSVDVEVLPSMPPAHEVAAYRVLMEATTNAVRHSGARRVAVRLRWDDGLHGEVEDDGRGLCSDLTEGVGLGAMAERADELGGWTTVDRSPGGCTIVRLWLPAVTV